jgi:uncharacterized membrane protein
MNTIILILTILATIIGLYISIKTFIETRKKYYNDFLKRKRNEEA